MEQRESFMKHVAVIGAGITGLTVAHALKKSGLAVSIFEAARTPGGVIRTNRTDGFLLESGPNSILAGGKPWEDLIDSLQLQNEVAAANASAKKRFIAKAGQLISLPSSPIGIFSSPFLSASGKLRFLKEPFVAKKTGDEDESLADFARRRFGREALDYLFNPFVRGIYAGRPEDLSVRHAFPMLAEAEKSGGSVTAGMLKKVFWKSGKPWTRKKMVSFNNGMEVLPQRLAHVMGDSLKLETRVASLAREGNRWRVGLESGAEPALFDSVVVTVPAHALPGLRIQDVPQQRLESLGRIPYASVRIRHLGFRRKDVAHPLDGFGFLVPEREGKIVLGVIFSSTLFPDRAPPDHVLLTVFAGGAGKPEVMDWGCEKLHDTVLTELRDYLGDLGRPVLENEVIVRNAIPQIIPGYGDFIRVMEECETLASGLFFGGNFRGGVSVLNCVENGLELAERVMANG
ncbi:MAG: protoporphyrinogen oxidase [Methylacidiphilales bacterium]|nr:protoporphyrinogen oxidase [Candidatus Methylacidiphilales bacterium]